MMLTRALTRNCRLMFAGRSWMSGFNNFNRRNKQPKKEDDPKKPIKQMGPIKPEALKTESGNIERMNEQMKQQVETPKDQSQNESGLSSGANQTLFQRRQPLRNRVEKPRDKSVQDNKTSAQQQVSETDSEKPSIKLDSNAQPEFPEAPQTEDNRDSLFKRRRRTEKRVRSEAPVAEQKPPSAESKQEQPTQNISFEERLKRARLNPDSKPPDQQNPPKGEDLKEDIKRSRQRIFQVYNDLGNRFNQKVYNSLPENAKRNIEYLYKKLLKHGVNPPRIGTLLLFLALFVGWAMSSMFGNRTDAQTINYTQLREIVMNEQVSVIYVGKLQDGRPEVKVRFSQGKGKSYECTCDSSDTVQRLVQEKNAIILGGNKTQVFHEKPPSKVNTAQIAGVLIPPLMLVLLISMLFKSRGNTGSNPEQLDKLFGSVFGKGKILKQTVNVKFNNVAGMDSAKKEITEFVDFLKTPERFHKLGARIPRGALLSGPPGTGKTLLAKACAGQANVSFFSLSGSEFVEMYVGVGASRVRSLFAEARENAPSIIFIDEIDAVGKKRSQGKFGGNDERDSTLNQLLVEMDGFSTKSNVVVFAATNKKELLDSALTRPGRFDRIIEVDLPDLEGRKQIFEVHLAPLKLNLENMTLQQYAKRMATLTPGFSGADIANLCNEAAIMAARKEKVEVSQIDFELANDRILSGTEKKSLMTPEERKIVAYHESGHAVVSWFVEGASPLLKLTIVPRSKGSLGFAQYLPDDRIIHTKQDLLDKLCVMMAGRIAEETYFNRVTTGARDDLDKVSQLANEIVRTHGMTEALGNVSFNQTEYLKNYSELYSKKIDEQVKLLVLQAERRARSLIELHKDKITQLAERLLEKDTIDNKTIRQVLGERPFAMRKDFKDYIENA